MKLLEFFYFSDQQNEYTDNKRYDGRKDTSVVKEKDKRKVRLTLRQINQLRKQTEAHQFEQAAEREFIQLMYGQPPAEEQPAA
jgi:hypothetical protein